MGQPLLEDQPHGRAHGRGEMRRHRHGLTPGRAVRHLASARHRDPPLLPAQEVVRPAPRRLAPMLHDLPRPGTHGDERHAEGRGQALLRAGHVEVHAPLVRAHVDPRDRGDRVQEEERADRARDLPDLRGRVGRAGRRLVVDQRDRLRARTLSLALQACQVEARSPLHRELGPVGAGPVHDLAHEYAELTRADHEHAVTGSMTESAPVSSAVRPEPGIMITSFFVWKTSRRASVVGSSTPSSKLRSYWIDGGWLIAWMTGKGSSVGPGIMRTGRVWHWAQLIVRDTLVSFVGGTAEPVPVVGGLTKMRASRLRYSNRIICSNPNICRGGREAGSHRGWPERGPTRLRFSSYMGGRRQPWARRSGRR